MASVNKLMQSVKLLNSGRGLSSSATLRAIQNVTVVGAGTMGAGIAQVKNNSAFIAQPHNSLINSFDIAFMYISYN